MCYNWLAMKKYLGLLLLFIIVTGSGCDGKKVGVDDVTSTDPLKVVAGGFTDVDIIEATTGVWRIFYGTGLAVTANNQLEIYSAVSRDGKVWEPLNTPILQWAQSPDVIKLPDGRLRLYFRDAQQGIIASATSVDGVSFMREAGVRLIPSGQLDDGGIAAPTVVTLPDGTYFMVYRADENKPYNPTASNPKTTALIAARSVDGLNFTAGDVVVDGRNDTFDGYVDGPELVFMDDGKLHLRFWTNADKDDQAAAGQYDMISDDFGVSWSQPTLFYPTQSTGLTGGDPTYLKINNQWRMFYSRRNEGIFSIPL